ncbi:MAG: hypothetical protein AMS14_00610 [Planctomycetes bacterium DG_20]|nr:MAG: hypothetical protein AMS14_00610 [Planctomycetes bacterium DG_20]
MTPPDSSPPPGRLFTRDQVIHDLVPTLLGTAFCSARWLAALFEPVRQEGQVLYRYRRGAYPPGGKQSLMRTCPACGRMSPPNGVPGSACCDCETEAAQEAFLARLRTGHGRDLAADLQRRWWPRRVTDAEFVACPTAGAVLGQDEGGLSVPETETQEGCAFDFAEWSDGPLVPEDRPQRTSLGDYRVALAIALRRLSPPKKEAGRHPGCRVVLLPETSDALKREIAYYRRTGRVIPSARRWNHPYRPEPPDSREQTLSCTDPGV